MTAARAPDAARAALDRDEGWIAAVEFEYLMRDTHGAAWRVVLREDFAALGLRHPRRAGHA